MTDDHDRFQRGARAANATRLGTARRKRATAIALRLSSAGPVFFRQTRCGLNGRHFTLMKFRTMAPGAEENWTISVQHSENDVMRFVDNFATMGAELRA